jgi:hypothetical protein
VVGAILGRELRWSREQIDSGVKEYVGKIRGYLEELRLN